MFSVGGEGVQYLINQHGQKFAQPKYLGEPPVRAATTADINNDGNADLVFGTLDLKFTLTTVLGDGKGDFGQPVIYPDYDTLGGMAVADFDEDGWPDLVIAGGSPGQVLFNDKGSFKSAPFTPFGVLPDRPVSVDMDNDGLPDIVFIENDPDTVYDVCVVKNTRHRTFGASHCAPYRMLDCRDFAVGDVNHDGFADVVCGDERTAVYVFFNQGDGTLASPVVLLNAPYAPVAIADLDGDHKDDLILGDGNQIVVYFNDTP